MAKQEEEVVLSTSAHDENLETTLARIEQRVNSVDDALEDLGKSGKVAGKAMDSGMEQAARGADEVKRSAAAATPPVEKLGDEAVKTGTKARAGASGLDKFAAKARKAQRQSRRLGGILMAYKLAAVVVGFFALAGALSAVAAGAGMAVGYLGPMLGSLVGLGPLALAAVVGLLAYKAAAEALTGPNNVLKAQFEGIGEAVASGGLASGLMDMANDVGGLGDSVRRGMGLVGGALGEGARNLGRWAASVPVLAKVDSLFVVLAAILARLLDVLAPLAETLLNVLIGAAPLAYEMAEGLGRMARRASAWTQAQLDSGRMTEWLAKGWRRTVTIGRALADFLVGMFNILRIGAGYAGDMDRSLAGAGASFRAWTTSAEGQARINSYFADSLPALRELGLILLGLARGLGTLGGNADVAPLLQQLRTEFGPAVADLAAKINGEGGLGPALISAATELLRFLAALDFSALTTFAVALASVVSGLVWLMQNVPGVNLLVSTLLFSILGFKAVGAVWGVVAKGIKAFGWMRGAMTATKGLSTGQKVFGAAVRGLGGAFKWFGGVAVAVIRAVGLAFMANPIIAAIVLIIGALVYLYTECEWFRDAVHAVLRWIGDAAVAAWEWIKNAFTVAIDAIVSAAVWLWENGIRPIWQVIATAAEIYWAVVSTVFTSVVDAIVTAAVWLWENGIRPVWEFISKGAEIAFGIIAWIVQVNVFIIMALIAGLAWVAEKVWDAIAAGASWLFDNFIGPLILGFKMKWNEAVSRVEAAWLGMTTALGIAWNWFYSNFIEPVIILFSIAWNRATAGVSAAWAKLTESLAAFWHWLYDENIKKAIDWFIEKWQLCTLITEIAWQLAVGKLVGLWDGFMGKVGEVIDWISARWGEFTSWLGELFEPVGNMFDDLWDGLSSAASSAAETVKGVWNGALDVLKDVWNWIAGKWNGIPSVTVPDWVPGIGGTSWSLPKLPTLWHGGPTPGGPALVGEHGPEPLVRGGRVVDVLGTNGPEVRDLPRGGYVVPNLSTLSALPGLARSIPPAVAAALAGGSAAPAAPSGGGDTRALLAALAELTSAVRDNRPVHVSATAGDVERDVLSALRTLRREDEARGRYAYTAGKG